MKRLALWVVGIVFVISMIGNMASKDEPKEEKKEEKVEEMSGEKEDSNDKPNEKDPESEDPAEYKIDIDKTIELNGATIVVQSLRVKDNIADLYAYWNHTSQYDKAHLELLVTTSIIQNGEYLEIIKGEDKFLDQKDKGIDGSLDLTFELVSDSPVEIKFTETTDDAKEEIITIELN